VGAGAIEALIRSRDENGVPRDIFDLMNNIDTKAVNKKALESLIKAGALDCFNPNRAAHLAVYESLLESAQQSARKNVDGQLSLFQMAGETMNTGSTTLPDVRNFDADILLAMEKDMTGVYITGHPLDKYREEIDEFITLELANLDVSGAEEEADNEDALDMSSEAGIKSVDGSVLADGDKVVICGMIAGMKTHVAKNGKMMAFVDIEDMTGRAEVIVFPNTYERYGSELIEEKALVVVGKLNFKEGEQPKILADLIIDIEIANPEDIKAELERTDERFTRRGTKNGDDGRTQLAAENGAQNVAHNHAQNSATIASDAVKVRIPEFGDRNGMAGNMIDEEALTAVMQIIKKHSGNQQVLIYLRNGKIVSPNANAGGGVRPTIDFAEEMALLVGNANVKIKSLAR